MTPLTSADLFTSEDFFYWRVMQDRHEEAERWLRLREILSDVRLAGCLSLIRVGALADTVGRRDA